jgi:hypothetical protein
MIVIDFSDDTPDQPALVNENTNLANEMFFLSFGSILIFFACRCSKENLAQLFFIVNYFCT